MADAAMPEDIVEKASVFDGAARETAQPAVDTVVVPRKLIEDARLALLWTSAKHVNKRLTAEAEQRLFDVHERLTAALFAASPPTDTGEGK